MLKIFYQQYFYWRFSGYGLERIRVLDSNFCFSNSEIGGVFYLLCLIMAN
jgi:hypothetical protein